MFKNFKIINFCCAILLLVIIIFILHIWASLIIPLLISFLISLAILWLHNFFIRFKIPKFISIILSIYTYFWVFLFFWFLIESNIEELILKAPIYQYRISNFLGNYDLPFITNSFLNNIDIQKIITSFMLSLTSIVSNFGMIILYIIFILLEYRFFWEKIRKIVHSSSKKKDILNTYYRIRNDIKTYFSVKTLVSFWQAMLSYMIMKSFWLDFAEFWSLLIFIFNYIPNIWWVLAIVFPAILSFLQVDISITSAFLIIILLIWVDTLMWNYIEPKYMWDKLNLSPVIIILSIWFWWSIWGVLWVFLAVPITVMLNIILAQFNATKNISILFSEKWDIPEITKKL